MVFACLMLSVFATIDEYEATASAILFYMVSKRLQIGRRLPVVQFCCAH